MKLYTHYFIIILALIAILFVNSVYAVDENNISYDSESYGICLNESQYSLSNNNLNNEYVVVGDGLNNYSANSGEMNNISTLNSPNPSDYYSLIFCNENYTIITGFNNNFSDNLSSDYFNSSILSPIKNQGFTSTCWAFASISTLESNLLKINPSLNYDFSEYNMWALMVNKSNYGVSFKGENDGGNVLLTVGYLTSWLGPVLESQDPFREIYSNSSLFNSTIHVQNVLFNEINNMNDIKKSIYNYGAVVLSYKHNITFYNSTYNSYYLNQSIKDGGHAISIVGWNDAFPKENFTYQPPGDGAWICKNSWGVNEGDNGLIYISYYDYYLTNSNDDIGTYTFILNDTNHYNRNYQYDTTFTRYKPSSLDNKVCCKNRYVSEGNDLLTSVFTYFFDKNTNYTISVYVNNQLKSVQSGFIENMGYYTILLDEQIPLYIGDTFEVSIELSRSSEVKFASCYDYKVTTKHHFNNVSFIYENNSWSDISNSGNKSRVACIKAFTVHNPFNTTLFLNVSDVVNRFDQVNITAYVVDYMGNPVLNGTVTFMVDNILYDVDIVDGFAYIPYTFENAGNFSVFAYFNGDYDYNPSYDYKYVFVNGENLNLSAFYSFDTFFNYTIIKVVLDANTNVTGNVYLFVNNSTYLIDVFDNVGFLNYPDLLDIDNTSSVKFCGNNIYNPSDNVGLIYLENMSHIICQTNNVFKYYHGPERFYVTLMYNGSFVANKSVIININGFNYTKFTDENGTASLALNVLPGIYDVFTYYVDVNGDLVTVHNLLYIHTTIVSYDVTKMFRNGTQYWALFLDSEGNPLIDTEVRFNINGAIYERLTNATGWARLNINLVAGEYVLTAFNPITNEEKGNVIIVVSKIESQDLTKYFGNTLPFVVGILGDDGNRVGAGETVKFNINGVFYTRSTNSSGQARLNINLNPGDYIITTSYMDCVASNYVHVLPILYANDLTKPYGSSEPFVVTLLDDQGNPAPNKVVSFNINGVIYNRTTNATGQARLNINLVYGEYVITTSFGGAVIANIIRIT